MWFSLDLRGGMFDLDERRFDSFSFVVEPGFD